MQRTSAFEASLPIVAAALGKFCGVKVEVGEGTPCTDGKTIRLPLVSANSPEEERKILGLLCHESAHIRFTDMKTPCKEGSSLALAIDNALEDARVERAMNAIYPGAEKFFEAAHKDIVAKIVSKTLRSDASIIPLFLLAVAERHILRRDWLQPLVDKTRKTVARIVGDDVTNALAGHALEVKTAKTIQDVRRIRQKVMKLLKATSQGTSGKKEDTKENAKADSSASDASSNAESEGSKECKEEGKKTAKSRNNENSSKSQDRPPRDVSKLKELLRKAEIMPVDNPLSLSKAFENLQGSKKSASTRLLPISDALRPIKGSADVGKKRLDQAKADSSALRTSLMALVQSKRTDHRWIAKRGMRLDAKRLSRLVVGDSRVFQGCSESKATNTAVHILLDLSGSMGLTGGELAIRAALGLIHALQSIPHVNPALTVFPGMACGQRNYACCTVVGHGKRLASVDPREIGALDSFGPTPIVGALTTARMALATCREDSKAVIVITDGGYFSDSLGEIIKEMEKQGIRFFGIQIREENGIERFISVSERIEEIADLKDVLFRFAKRLLLS